MKFTKRETNSKSKVLPTDFSAIKELNIRSLVVMDDIPKELVINWD